MRKRSLMFVSTVSHITKSKSAFVLVEVIVASLVAVFVFLGVWSIYQMAWRWWHETAPLIEAQRIARTALSSIIDGTIDATVGQDATYPRRNGIAWAVYEPVISSNLSLADKIEFGLEAEKEYFEDDDDDSHNVRAFYLGLDPVTGSRLVYYKDFENGNSTTRKIRATLGITDLKFEKLKDDSDKVYVKVTATVEKDILGTRGAPYHVKIEYVDSVYLRNF